MPEVIRDQLAEYYGLITHLNEQVGRILRALEENGQAENTKVVYAAGHGLAMGSHGLLGKQNLYEHSMRCPLISRWPGIPQGSTTDAFTYLFDLFPALLGLASAETPPGIDGRELAALWSGAGDTAWRQSLFLPYRDLMRAVRDERYKLIVYPKVNHRQLFDLADDPDELHSLAADPAHRQAPGAGTGRVPRQPGAGDPARLSSGGPGGTMRRVAAHSGSRRQGAWGWTDETDGRVFWEPLCRASVDSRRAAWIASSRDVNPTPGSHAGDQDGQTVDGNHRTKRRRLRRPVS